MPGSGNTCLLLYNILAGKPVFSWFCMIHCHFCNGHCTAGSSFCQSKGVQNLSLRRTVSILHVVAFGWQYLPITAPLLHLSLGLPWCQPKAGRQGYNGQARAISPYSRFIVQLGLVSGSDLDYVRAIWICGHTPYSLDWDSRGSLLWNYHGAY